jgi:hypothetical protein
MSEESLFQAHRADLIASAQAFAPEADPAQLAAAFDHWRGQVIGFEDFATIYQDVSGEPEPKDYDSTPEQGFFDEYLNSERSTVDKAVATLMALAKNNGMYQHNTAAALVAANTLLYADNAGLLIIPPADSDEFNQNIRQHYVRDHIAITKHIKDAYLIHE